MSVVAVITPIYATAENGRLELFDQTRRSVARQSYPRFVYLIVDDGSTVDVEGYLRSFDDPRIRYVRREKKPTDLRTASNALNFGIDYCLKKSGDVFTRQEAEDLKVVGFLHSDDLQAEYSIERRVERLSRGFVYSQMALFDNKGNVLRIRKWRGGSFKDFMEVVRKHSLFNHHTIMWDLGFLQYLKDYVAERYQQEGVFDPSLSHGEDRDMSLSSIEAAIRGGYEARYIPYVTVLYRCHEQSITNEPVDSVFRKAQDDIIFRKHYDSGLRGKMAEILDRLLWDPPWSFFTFLPEEAKRKLRPIRNKLRLSMPTKETKDLENYLLQCMA